MATSVTLRQLEYFVAIARTGSMARAAQHLHVSAAAVSLGLGQLERLLECELFLRRPHQPLTLTQAGRELLSRAAAIVSDSEELMQVATQSSGSLRGTIHVGCFDTLAPFLVPHLLAVAGERYPELSIEVNEGTSGEVQDQLLAGVTDLAVLYGLELRPSLRTEVIRSMRPYVVVPADHRVAGRAAVHLAELAGEPMILLDSPPSRLHVVTTLALAGVSPVRQLVTRNFETLRSLVGRGHGWGVLVQHPAIDRSYEGLELRRVEIADAIEPAPVVVATVAAATLPRRTMACIDIVRTLPIGNDVERV